jgi:glycerol dehydrogenase-like iron-containing ADH family enzyme
VAHAIHNRFTHQPELHDWLHGEKVGFGLLVQSLMESDDGQPELQLLSLLREYDAPLALPPLNGDRDDHRGHCPRSEILRRKCRPFTVFNSSGKYRKSPAGNRNSSLFTGITP